MATRPDFVDDLLARIACPGLAARRMFGEYALDLGGKVVALVCDNQLFVKPTDAGRALLRRIDEAPPYPGAKPHLRIVDEFDDPAALRRLLATTADALPAPKPKREKADGAARGVAKKQARR